MPICHKTRLIWSRSEAERRNDGENENERASLRIHKIRVEKLNNCCNLQRHQVMHEELGMSVVQP